MTAYARYYPAPYAPPKDKALAFILWLCGFVGFCGIHRFYLGKWGTGLIWLFTGGLLMIGQILDVFFLSAAVDRHNRRFA